MAESLYRKILRQAWDDVVSRHKVLWFLGLVGTFLGAGGQYEFLLNQYTNFSAGDWSGVADLWQVLPTGAVNFINYLGELAGNLPAGAWLALALSLAFILFSAVVVISSQGALILGAAKAISRAPVRLGELYGAALKSFWHLLAVLVSARLLALFVLAVIGLPVLAIIIQFDAVWAWPGFVLLFFVLALPVVVIFSIVAKFALASRMIELAPWRAALARALALFAGHWLVAVEMALALFVINLAAAVVFVFAAGFLSLPFIFSGLVLGELGYALALNAAVTIGLILFLFLVLLLGSALAAYQSAAWTLLFLRIKDERQLPKLVRLLAHWREKYS